MSENSIEVQSLGKSYSIAHNATHESTAIETVLRRVLRPLERQSRETFWALKEVSFEVKKGDVLGVIGRNGAGKSTLLKVLSRITEPTSGEVRLRGRVGSLLEVGTGFHPELTGRENIYLNGAILGMTRKEITRQFEAIVDFSGVEQFLDTPVKRYSSGMYVRLAFAVAAHLQSEIMIVDEVLAVGDAEFQRKCLGKMHEVAKGGRTVVFVSHHMQSVANLCRSALYLEKGAVKYAGDVGEAIEHYMNYKPENRVSDAAKRGGSGECRIVQFQTDKEVYLSTDNISFEMEVVPTSLSKHIYFVSVEITNAYGLVVLHMDSRLLNREFSAAAKRTINYEIVNPRLAQGEYFVNVFLGTAGGIMDRLENTHMIRIAPILPYPTSRGDVSSNAITYPDFSIEETAAEVILPGTVTGIAA